MNGLVYVGLQYGIIQIASGAQRKKQVKLKGYLSGNTKNRFTGKGDLRIRQKPGCSWLRRSSSCSEFFRRACKALSAPLPCIPMADSAREEPWKVAACAEIEADCYLHSLCVVENRFCDFALTASSVINRVPGVIT